MAQEGTTQIGKAMEEIAGSGRNIVVIFLDLGPEVREEIRDLKQSLRELTEMARSDTIARKVIHAAFAMDKKPAAPIAPVIPPPARAKVDPTVLTDGERRLFHKPKWDKQDWEDVLANCGWDRDRAATKFGRNYVAICVALKKHQILPPSGKWNGRGHEEVQPQVV